MVAFYVVKIQDGTITIEDVPKLWKRKGAAGFRRTVRERKILRSEQDLNGSFYFA